MDLQYLLGLTSLNLLSVCPASNACVLRTSSCFAHIRTWSLVTSLDLFMVLRLLSIFFDILIVNAMDKLLFYLPIELLIPAFFAAILTLFIHSSTFSLLCPLSLQNWRDFTLSLSSLCSAWMVACLSIIFCALVFLWLWKMFFTSSGNVYYGEGLPCMGLMPALSPVHLVRSSPSPLLTSIACTTAFAATMVSGLWFHSYILDWFPFLIFYLLSCLFLCCTCFLLILPYMRLPKLSLPSGNCLCLPNWDFLFSLPSWDCVFLLTPCNASCFVWW